MMEPFAYDWANFDESGQPKMQIYCVCGRTYRSHYALVKEQGKYISITRDPCPGCGKGWDNVVKVTPVSLIHTIN